MRIALTRLAATLRDLRGYRQAILMLVAFLIYNDGISTIIRMATIYTEEQSMAIQMTRRAIGDATGLDLQSQ